MADNVTADPGTGGAVFATDDISSVHYPLGKFGFGALDSFTIASSNAGNVDAGTQRVVLASDQAVVSVDDNAGSLTVDIGAAATAAGDLAKAEDAIHGSGDVGVMALAVRNDALVSLVDTDGDYAPLQVDADGALYTKHPNTISTNNSTTSTLTSASTFTGTGDDVSSFASVTVQVDASHDSATDGMTFQFSIDNTNWDDIYTWTYTAADGARRFQFPVTAQYFRVVYTNGGTGQTHFRVQTILHGNAGLTTIHRLVDSVDPDRSATLSKSAIIAQAAGTGDFVPVQATATGNLKMSVEEISGGLDIGAGNAGAETQRVSISTDDVNLSSINTDAGTIAGAVAGTEMQVDVVAPLPAGTNAIGKLAANSGVDIGDVDVITYPGPADSKFATLGQKAKAGSMPVTLASDEDTLNVTVATALPAGSNNIGDVDVLTQPARDNATDNIGAALQTDVIMNDTTALTPKYAIIDAAASGDNTLVAAVATKKIRVLQVILVAAAAVNVRFEDGAAGTALSGQMNLTTNSGFEASFCPVGHFETTSNTLLNLELSGAVSVDGWLVYVEV